MNTDDLFLSHPHDFFNVKRLGTVPGTCFVIMPFASRFRIVYDTIVEALQGRMVCTRADDLNVSSPILERIMRGIASAELIIADITGNNSNVFYELGLAHMHTKRVLLITQQIKKVPFDLTQLYCHRYAVDSKAELDALKQVIQKAADEVMKVRLPTAIESTVARTQQIINFMNQKLSSPVGAKGLLIRLQATISSFGNVSQIVGASTGKYDSLLEEERNLLVALIEAGAAVQAIISPQVLPPGSRESPSQRSHRIDRLLDFLKSDLGRCGRCSFVISPASGPNLMFFGEEVLFEGHKTEVERGFGWTAVYTDPAFIASRAEIFDRLYESARLHTLQLYGSDGGSGNESIQLSAAVIQALTRFKSTFVDDGETPWGVLPYGGLP